MITLLAKLFIKNRDGEEARGKYGILCGGVGIFLNVLLFALKLFVGTLSGSVAVTADAYLRCGKLGGNYDRLPSCG